MANNFYLISNEFKNYLGPDRPEAFKFQRLTPDILCEAVANLKPKASSGPDMISTKMLKSLFPALAPVFTHAFNLSFQLGMVPAQHKIAKVIPIHKAGPAGDFNNYRPISLLNSASKLLERLVARQLTGYLNKHDLLYDNQYGFRKGRSTLQPVLVFLNHILSNKVPKRMRHTAAIFLDLKKAFDTVSHRVLLNKLRNMGVCGIALKWFTDYLSDRKQSVSINGTASDLLDVTCGVPQGSILGPLLFLIYINDMPLAVRFLTLLFADDTTLQMSDQDAGFLNMRVNDQLIVGEKWFRANFLTLNVAKTKYMLFPANKGFGDASQVLNLVLDGKKIEKVSSFKFVGLHLDELLSWDVHHAHVVKKVASGTGILARLKRIVPQRIRLLIYNALIKPHLNL